MRSLSLAHTLGQCAQRFPNRTRCTGAFERRRNKGKTWTKCFHTIDKKLNSNRHTHARAYAQFSPFTCKSPNKHFHSTRQNRSGSIWMVGIYGGCVCEKGPRCRQCTVHLHYVMRREWGTQQWASSAQQIVIKKFLHNYCKFAREPSEPFQSDFDGK